MTMQIQCTPTKSYNVHLMGIQNGFVLAVNLFLLSFIHERANGMQVK